MVTKGDYQLWLVNESSEDVNLTACELFGFNAGSWQEKLAGDKRF